MNDQVIEPKESAWFAQYKFSKDKESQELLSFDQTPS